MDETQFKKETQTVRPKLLAVALRHTADSDTAEDIVQDALLRLWQIHETLRSPMAPLACVLTRNLAIDALRRHKPTTSVEGLAVAEEVSETDPRYERVMKLLHQLPPLQQTLFRLRHAEGMEYADIAQLTGTTPEAVRQSVSRARRTILKQYHSSSCKISK